MLLTLTTTHRPATDLGYLLHKNPARVQEFDLSFGRAHILYPEATDDRCTCALLLDVDPVALVRARGRGTVALDQYVNDRPYAASSFLSVAIAQVFGSAVKGTSRERPDLAVTPIPLEATLSSVPGGPGLVHDLFEPLGYQVETTDGPMDPAFPDWGPSPTVRVTLRATTTVALLLTHLYVLVPVLDNDKHYWVGEEEVRKLLRFGEGWLKSHPRRDQIVRRYLLHFGRLSNEALSRLREEDQADPDAATAVHNEQERAIEEPLSLNQQRLGAVVAALKAAGAQRILDLGCGEGRLIRALLPQTWMRHVTGVDVSVHALRRAAEILDLDKRSSTQLARITLLQGSLMYRDRRLEPSADNPGFDAAAIVEVIEHLDPPRLAAMERTVFEFIRPPTVVVTTPNAEYNIRWETLPAGRFRHADHRFEWNRDQFRAWCDRIASRFGYAARVLPIGPDDPEVGSPTQMGVFSRATADRNGITT